MLDSRTIRPDVHVGLRNGDDCDLPRLHERTYNNPTTRGTVVGSNCRAACATIAGYRALTTPTPEVANLPAVAAEIPWGRNATLLEQFKTPASP
jgi:hypothetical protein